MAKLGVAQNPGAGADADRRARDGCADRVQCLGNVGRIETFLTIGPPDVKVNRACTRCNGLPCGRCEFGGRDGNCRVFGAGSASVESGFYEHWQLKS
jgi:hypothetical protein